LVSSLLIEQTASQVCRKRLWAASENICRNLELGAIEHDRFHGIRGLRLEFEADGRKCFPVVPMVEELSRKDLRKLGLKKNAVKMLWARIIVVAPKSKCLKVSQKMEEKNSRHHVQNQNVADHVKNSDPKVSRLAPKPSSTQLFPPSIMRAPSFSSSNLVDEANINDNNIAINNGVSCS
jgi:hypothetical protein